MKGDLEHMNDFDINDTTLAVFHNMLEHLELSYEIKSARSEPKQKEPKEDKKASGRK
jgi:hypothetical protein